jgi:uncharacterized membrane protein
MLIVVLVAAFLTKINALGFLPVLLTVTTIWIVGAQKARVRRAAAALICLLLVASTWSYISQTPYVMSSSLLRAGQQTVLQMLSSPLPEIRITIDLFEDTWAYAAQTYIGVFGWGNVPLPTGSTSSSAL